MSETENILNYQEVEDLFAFREKIVRAESLKDLYKISAEKIHQLISCDFSFIYLLTKRNTFEKEQHAGPTDFPLKREYKKTEAFTEWLGKEKRSVKLIEEVNLLLDKDKVGQLLLYPLNNEVRTFGYIGILREQREVSDFCNKAKNLLGIFARVISFVASTKKQANKLDTILRVFREVRKKKNKKEMFQQLADTLTNDSSNFSGCIVHLYDEIKQNLYGYVSAGFEHKKEGSSRVELGTNIIGEVYNKGQIIIAETEDDRFLYPEWAKTNNYVSIISIQLIDFNKNAYGVISLFTQYEYFEIKEDQKFLSSFITQASILIKSIQNKERLEKLKKVDEIISEIIPFEKSFKEIAALFLERSLESLKGQFGFISLFEKDSNEIKATHEKALDENFANIKISSHLNLNKRNSLAGYVYHEKKSYLYGSDKAIDKLSQNYKNLGEAIVKSEILVPLLYQDEFIGIMVLSSTVPHVFSREDLEFLESIAAKVAQVIQTKRFHDSSQELNAFKYKTLKEKEIWQETAVQTRELLDTSVVCIWVLDKDFQVLELAAESGLNLPPLRKNLLRMKKKSASLAWHVIVDAQKNKNFLFTRTFKESDKEKESFVLPDFVKKNQLKTIISVPIIHEKKILGLIETYTKRIYPFFEHDSILLKNIAIRCAGAVANARLDKERTDALEKWTSSNAIANPGIVALSFVHDIQHYIHGLNSDLNLLENFIPKDIKNYPMINDILDSASKNSGLIRRSTKSLVRIGKRVKTKKKTTPLKEIIENVKPLFARRFEVEKIALMYKEYPKDRITVDCYPNEIEQVFVNLTLNAIDALSKKLHGRREIKIEVFDGITEFGSNWIKIRYTDNGMGIKKRDLGKVFDINFSTKGEEGSGFGLSISRRIIEEKHSGKLKVGSKFGEETTFIIYLPKY